MKKIIACSLTTLLAITILAEETTNVDYGQATQSPTLDLIWKFERESSGGVTYAVITGVAVSGGENPTGDITVPLSLVCSDNTPLVVKKIADGAFANQIGISSISIPATIETVGAGMFTGCTILSQISVDENNPWLASSAGALYDKDRTRILACPPRIETIQLPATLKEIAPLAFASCHRLAALTVPDAVEAIGTQAFLDCARLTSVSFEGNAPAADASIVDGANVNLCFYKKPGTTGWDAAPWNGFNVVESAAEQPSGIVSDKAGNVTWFYRVINGEAEIYNGGFAAIPTSTSETYTYEPATFEWVSDGRLVIPTSLGGYPVTRIGDYAFIGCSGISNIEIPKTIRRIGDYAFANCSSLGSVTLPTGIKEIGYRPFAGASITTLALPDSLRSLTGNPLAGCDTLLTVSISLDNSYYTVVNGILYDKDVRSLVGCPARKESASIATTAERIGPEAFDGCFRLRALLLPSNLASVGECAFCDMPRLASLVFPASVDTLEGAGLFEGCGSLEFIGFSGNAPAVDPQLFRGAPAGLQIYVAQGTKGWNGDPSSTALPASGKWPSDDEYGRSIANLDVSAEAELKEGDIFVCITTNGTTQYAHTLKVLSQRGVEILEISPKPIGNYTVPSDFISSLGTLTVKSLGNRLFANSTGLLSVEIPNAITNIGSEAFADCNVLMDVKLNHGLRSIGRHPFAGTAIEAIALPDTVSSIDGNILYGCDPSVSLSVGGNNPYFAVSTEGALYDKDFTSLFACPMTAEEIEVPATVAELADECLAGCIRLKKVTFLGNAPTAADDVFADTPATMTSYAKEDAGFTSGTWKDRPIVIVPSEVIVDTNTDGTWVWTLNGDVATLCNGGYSALLDTNYIGAVSVPAQVTDSGSGKQYTVAGLGDHALYGCRFVNAVTIPATIISIGAEPFAGTRIAAIAIPAYVETIDGNPAAGCARFTGFTVDADNIDFSADDAGCLYDHSRSTLLAVPPRAEEIEIPATVAAIADDAFAGCVVLKKTTFLGNAPAAADTIFADTPATMTSYADASASGFTSGTWKGRPIVIVGGDTPPPGEQSETVGGQTWYYRVVGGVAEIWRDGKTAVASESPITDLTLPDALGGHIVKGVGEGALSDLRGLTALSIPATYEWIGDGAFSNCTSLASVTLGNGLRTIGRHPFDRTNVGEVSIPASVSSIDGNVLYGCSPAATVSVASGNQRFALSDDGALYDKGFKTLYAVPMSSETLTVPETTTTINDDAFADCMALANVKFLGNAPAAADGILADTPATLVITVLDGSLGWDGDPASRALPASGIWRNRKIEQAAGETAKYTDSSGIEWDVTVYGNKAELGANGATPVIPASTSGEVTVPGEITIDGKTRAITAIPDGAFDGCSEITSINIPASITSIAADAFNGCTSLESFSVDSKNPAYSSRSGILYSKDGKTLVKVPAKTSFAATFTEKENTTKKDIVEIIGSTNPDTMTTAPNQIIERRSYGKVNSTTVTEFTPSVSAAAILSGVTAISDYAFTDCGLLPAGSTVSGTLIVKKDGKETTRKTGTFTLPVGTDSTGWEGTTNISSQAGFYNGSVCLYHTALTGGITITKEVPFTIPATVTSCGDLAFEGSHFTAVNKAKLLGVSSPTGANRIALSRIAGDGNASYGPFTPGVPISLLFEDFAGFSAKGVPAGLRWTARTGVIEGTPGNPGTYTVTFSRRVNANGKYTTETKTVNIRIAEFPVMGIKASVLDAAEGRLAVADDQTVEAYVGVEMSMPIDTSNELDGSPSSVSAQGLPAGLRLVKTPVKNDKNVIVRYLYSIEGIPSRAQAAKKVTLNISNRKKWKGSTSFAIKVLSLPNWSVGNYNGICHDNAGDPIGAATAGISAAGRLSAKVMVPSDDGKRAANLTCTASGFKHYDAESGTLSGVAKMRIGKENLDVPFTLTESKNDGTGSLSFSFKDKSASLVQNIWNRKDLDPPAYKVNATTEVGGLMFKLAANGKVIWSGRIEGDNGRLVSVSGTCLLLNGPTALVYIPPRSNLVGGRCELVELWQSE